MISFTKNEDSLTVFFDGNVTTIPSDAPNFVACWNAVKESNEDALREAIEYLNNLKLETVKGSGIEVNGNGVFFNGQLIDNNITQRIMSFLREGAPTKPLIKFLEKFMSNPAITSAYNPEVHSFFGVSKAQIEKKIHDFASDFWAFLSHNNLPVTEDGDFLAYKTVRSDYLDKYTGTYDNSPGKTVEEAREKVNPDRSVECSHGLHVGCLDYAGPNGWYHKKHEGDRVVIVKVNPQDVVAVPPDHNRTKMRVCKYTVIGDYNKPLERAVYSGEVNQQDLDLDVKEVAAPTYELEELHFEDVVSFDYKKDGVVKRRYMIVEDFWMYGKKVDSISGKLVSPEEQAGKHRMFKAKNISNVRLHV